MSPLASVPAPPAVRAPRPLGPAALLPALPGLGLDELNAAAALQTRVDRKYALSRDAARSVLAELPLGTRVLAVPSAAGGPAADAASLEPLYRSVYFDTPDLASFLGAARGRRQRFKVRTRAYVDSELAFVEVKRRGARSTTVKERLPHPLRDAERLTEPARAYAASVLGDLDVAVESLHPMLVSRYRRATLLQADGASRATVDAELSWRDPEGGVLERPDLVIIETKSAVGASPLDRLLWRSGHRPRSLSKYATGLAALRPGLPANRWHRVLATHFTD